MTIALAEMSLTALPAELCNLIVSYADKEDLRHLRLTCHRLNLSATEHLFAILNARMHDEAEGEVHPSHRLTALRAVSSTHLAVHVQRLRIGLPPTHGTAAAVRSYLSDLNAALPLCTPHLTRLNAVEVKAYCQYIHGVTSRADVIRTAHEAIQSVLRHSMHSELQELCLSLPAFDNALDLDLRWCRDVLNHLRSFAISVLDKTEDCYLPYLEDEVPSQDYARLSTGLLKLLSYAGTVDKLYVKTSRNLSFDAHAFVQQKLRILNLSGFRISAETLVAFLQTNKLTLQTIGLNHGFLTSGTWKYILDSVVRLPKLTSFSMHGCNYCRLGSSLHLFRGEVDQMIDREDIWTMDYDDILALDNVYEVVRTRNGSVPEPVLPVYGPPMRAVTLLDRWLGLV